MSRSTVEMWVVAAIVVLGTVGLVAWARNEPGAGGRDPDPPSSVVVVVPVPPPPATVVETVPQPTTT